MRSLSLAGPPRGGLQGIEVHVLSAGRAVSFQQPCFSAAELLDQTSRAPTEVVVHTSARSFPLFSGTLIHRSSPWLLVARFTARARSRQPSFALQRKDRLDEVRHTATSGRRHLTSPHTQTSRCLAVSHWSEPAGHADRPRRPTRNWLCSTLLLFRCFFCSSRDAPCASAGESPIAQGTKNPSASAAVSGFIHKRSRLA